LFSIPFFFLTFFVSFIFFHFLPFPFLLNFLDLFFFSLSSLYLHHYLSLRYVFHAALFIPFISLLWQKEHVSLNPNTTLIRPNLSVNCATFSFWPRFLCPNGDKHFPYVSVKDRMPASSLHTVISLSEPSRFYFFPLSGFIHH
jgi:hypothetical protein